MVLDPRTEDEISDSLASSLKGKVAKLTNFVSGSFNRVWIDSFSAELHEAEVQALAAQLSGWVDYAGTTDFTQEDLDELGIDGVDPDELNEYMAQGQLDKLGELLGIERDQGQKATGQVTVQTATDSTRVPEGMEVGTEPDFTGDYQSYFVDADGDGTIGDSGYVTPDSGKTEVTVDVIAGSVGDEFNVGAGTVTFLPDPPVGVESVNNSAEINGGIDVQSNASYRSDIKNAVFVASGGGTSKGIIGYITENVDGVLDVAIDEFVSQQPPYVDVIVDGGTDSDVTDAINASRPTGVDHNLVRPETIEVGVRSDVTGTDIDDGNIEDEISNFLTNLSLDDQFHRSQLTQLILNTDADIVDLTSLSVSIRQITDESHTYQSGTSIYELDFAPIGDVTREEFMFDDNTNVYDLLYTQMADADVTVTAIVDNAEVTLTEGTDYEVIDDDGDTNNDALDFGIGGTNPDDNSTVEVDYTHSSWTISSTIEDENGNTYDKGTDWDLIDNDTDGLQDSIDWSIGGSSPSDGDRWTIDYNPKKTARRDIGITKREKITASSVINVRVFSAE